MEVVCSSCGTEYDFDEARVPSDGVTVKCTTCGHVFKVTKQGAEAHTTASPSPQKKGAHWQIKKVDGDHLSFKALSTLQKWIVERKVSAEDQISRTGDKWTKLADVPEFQVFFQALGPAPQLNDERAEVDELSSETVPEGGDDTEEAPETKEEEKETPPPKVKVTKKAKSTAAKKKTRGVAKRGTVKKKKRTGAKESNKNITLEAFMQESDSDTNEEEAKATHVNEQKTTQKDDAFLEDDDPIQIWKAQKQKRMTMMAIVFSSFMAILFIISVIHTLTGPEPKKVVAKAPAIEQNQPTALIRTLPDVLSSDNVKRIKALLYEIDNVLGAGGLGGEMQGLLYGAKGRLYLSLARMEKELAHLHFLHYQNLRKMRPKEAKIALNQQRTTVKQAENFFSKAQVSIATANEAAGAHPLTLLAKADKNAYEGGMDLMRLTLKKARTLGQQYRMDAVIHYEAKVIAGLGNSLKSMEDKDLRLVIDSVTNLHILLNGKWYQDKRIVYLSIALGLIENTLQTLPNFTRIDHLRQGMDVFSSENPTHQRALLINEIAKDILPKKNPSKEARKLSKIERNVDKIRSLRLKGKHKKAVRKLIAMAKKYPREVAPVAELGWAYLSINKSEKALSYFNEAVRISPTHAMSNYGRAEALRLSGKPHQALEAYERFLAISPQGPEARAARNSIDVIIEMIEMSGRNQKYRINKMQKRSR